jgi:ribosomal protein L37AE/L43A
MNQPTPVNPVESAATEDILFECPQCGKSLEIDARGAGYIIICPDCKNEIQVPAWNASVEVAAVELDPETRQRVKIEEMLNQLQTKVTRLEKQHQVDDHCFKRLGDELNLIQSAIDRITEIIETRKAEG